MKNYSFDFYNAGNLKAYNLNEVPVGCVIVKDDKIIARAHNLRNTKKNRYNFAYFAYF